MFSLHTFSLQCFADHSSVRSKCQLPQSCICKFSDYHLMITWLKIYTYMTEVLFYVSFCPRLPSRRMLADRFVTAVLTASALWLTELLGFDVYLLPNVHVLLKLALLVRTFEAKKLPPSVAIGLQQTPGLSQFCNDRRLLKSEVITWISNQIIYFPSHNLCSVLNYLFVYLKMS